MSWTEDPGVNVFEKFNITELNVDEAWLNVSSMYPKPVWLYELSSNCHACPFERKSPSVTPILPGHPQVFKITTRFSSIYRLITDGTSRLINSSDQKNTFCEVSSSAGEFGVYELSAYDDRKCLFVTKLDPVNIYYPLILLLLVYTCLAIFICLWQNYGQRLLGFLSQLGFTEGEEATVPLSTSTDQAPTSSLSEQENAISGQESMHPRRRKKRDGKSFTVKHAIGTNAEPSSESSTRQSTNRVANIPTLTPPKQRFQSIDTFRGICIAIMIFVDDGGGEYNFFEHATWDGLTVADLAFPWFLWVMGICIPISIQSQKRRNESKRSIFNKILIRSIKLVLLGLAMNTSSSPRAVSLETLRFPGVLQRFGFCYFIASSLYLFLARNDQSQTEAPDSQSGSASLFEDFKITFIPWLIIVSVMMLHSLITLLLSVPGCPTGYLGPAGLHMGNKFPAHCIGGSAGYLDRLIFSERHIYPRPTAKRIYKTGSFDPEGLLGSLTSLFQVWLGVQTGVIILIFSQSWSKLSRFASWAAISGFLGGVLCGGISNAGWIPVNKNLWSLSYVFTTTSLAWSLLLVLYFVIDVKNIWSGSPFYQAGKNSILLYVGHSVARNMIPWNYAFGRMNTHFSHLIESVWGTSLWIFISIYLCNRKLFWVV